MTRSEDIRVKESFAETGAIERVLPGGVVRGSNFYPDTILRVLAWYPVCIELGPEAMAGHIKKELRSLCSRYLPGFTPVLELASNFLINYMRAYDYDPLIFSRLN